MKARASERLNVLATFEAAVAEDLARTTERLVRAGWELTDALEGVVDHYRQLVDDAGRIAMARLAEGA